jgi:hypothetical protein
MRHSHSLRTLVMVAWLTLATPLPGQVWPADDPWSSPDAWLCLPGRSDLCAGPIRRMTLDSGGKVTRDTIAANTDAPVDCFYVYPTISTDPAGNSSLTPGPGERRAVEQQFAALSSVCKPYAPMYRQITLAGLISAMSGKPLPMDRELAYADVAAAWRHYLAEFNKGRGVVLIGHSQGSRWLADLLQREIEGQPVQKRIVAVYLAGYNFEVPAGQLVGGTLKTMPLCAKAAQTGCVVAWTSFRASAPPSENSRYGVSRNPAVEIGCVDPVALSQKPLSSYLSVNANLLGVADAKSEWQTLVAVQAQDATFVDLPGLLSTRCVKSGNLGYLAVDLTPTADGRQPADIPGDIRSQGKILQDWGLHLVDVNLVMGNLRSLIRQQSAVYADQAH